MTPIRFVSVTVAGAAALFLYHSVAWMVPAHQGPIGTFGDEDAVVAAVDANLADGPGTYFLNVSPEGPDGAWGWVSVYPEDAYSMGRNLGGAALLNQLVALGCVLLVRTSSATTFRGRFALVLGVGAVGALAGPLWLWNWNWFSNGYAAVATIDHVLGFALLGLVIGALWEPRKSTARPGALAQASG